MKDRRVVIVIEMDSDWTLRQIASEIKDMEKLPTGEIIQVQVNLIKKEENPKGEYRKGCIGRPK